MLFLVSEPRFSWVNLGFSLLKDQFFLASDSYVLADCSGMCTTLVVSVLGQNMTFRTGYPGK